MWRSMVLVAVILISGIAIAGDTPWQFDKAKIASMSVNELVATGDQLRGQKDYLGAARLFEEAIRRQPKDAAIFNKLGLVELQSRQIDNAASHFNKAIKLNPKYADALNNYGATSFLKGDLDKAARYYRKALALDETHAAYHVNLAVVWERQNKINLALVEYARALELDPDALVSKSNTGVAAQLLTKEQNANRYFLLARVFAIRGDYVSSLEYLKKAKEENYRDLRNVYKLQEFAKLWNDPRLTGMIPR